MERTEYPMPNDPTDVLQDAARLTALHRLALLDNPTEYAFDRFTRLIAKLVGVPVSMVSFIDDKRQFVASQVGLAEPWASRGELPLSHSFCQYVVGSGGPLIVDNAPEHPLLRDNPAIRDLAAVAYVGMPLVTSQQQVLGSLCMMDSKPRTWTPDEIEIIRDMATFVATTLDLRNTLLDLQESLKREAALQQEVAELHIVIDEVKRQQSVDEIVNTEFFENLRQRALEERGRLRSATDTDAM